LGGLGYVEHILNRPRPTAQVDRATLGFSDERNVVGDLYYPRAARPDAKMPVIIWLHPYSYSKGYSDLPILPESSGASAYTLGTYPLHDQGYLGTDFKVNPLVLNGFGIFTYDMIGFGTRIPEVRRFYERFPHWSLMGKMVDDVRSAVDLLSDNERVDSRRIYVMGYSLGATVAMLAAALDDRIAGVVSFSGFTPLRAETARKGTGSIENHAQVPDASEPDASLGFADRDQLERGFRRLETDQRTVLVLHYYLGLTLDEAAEILGIPPGTVRSRLHRAIAAMRAALEADARTNLMTQGRPT
jgi:RNA polymerase sigma factor (sigma-70 family)